MSVTGQNIINQINLWVRNYAVTAFHDMRLNSILQQIVQFIDAGGGGAGTIGGTLHVTSANFTSAVDCPLTALNGANLVVFWNDKPGYLKKGTEWLPLVGGGFTIQVGALPGFDAGSNSYEFYITIEA